MSIKFSILTPVYKVEKYIDECIQSVLAQTYDNYEFILVDDGSPDSSGEICDRYAEKYPQIKVYHKENGGAFSARIYAIEHATGDYCVFLDSDDTLNPNTLQILNDTVSEYSCDCVIFGLDKVRNGKKLFSVTVPEVEIITDKRELYRKCFFSRDYNSMCTKCVRKGCFGAKDYSMFYHVTHGEDLIQSIEIFQKSDRVVFIPDILYYYRETPNSAMEGIRYENYRMDFTARKVLLDFLIHENVFTEQDFIEYRGYCIRSVIITIITISMFKTSAKNKYALFDKLKDTNYYADFLNNGAYDPSYLGNLHYVYKLFEKNHYTLLVMRGRLARLYGSLNGFLKNKGK